MNTERTIAIASWENADRIEKIVDSLPVNESIVIYVKKDSPYFDAVEHLKADKLNVSDVVAYPDGIDTDAKVKNFVISESKKAGIKKVHILEDAVEIYKDPTQFINDIENLLHLLGLNTFLGTVTDECNYVYSKYVPRLRVKIDDELKGWKEKLKVDEVIFCSHSNTYWMYFDLEHADDSELRFNDSFQCQMYWIIEYLARRRNDHPQSMYFMNQYVTCSSEKGVYGYVKVKKNVSPQEAQDEQKALIEKMKADHQLFMAMAVDNHPDSNQNIVVERLYKLLGSKVQDK